MNEAVRYRAASSLFAILAITLIAQFAWTLLSTVPQSTEPGGYVAEVLRDAGVVLTGLASLGGIVAALVLAVALARRGSEEYTNDVILFLTSSALGVATQLIPAAAHRLVDGFELLWSGIPLVRDHLTTLTFLVAGVSYVRFTARFPVCLREHEGLGGLGKITAVYSLGGLAWLWLGLIPILMLDRGQNAIDGLLGFGWSFLLWLFALLVLSCAGLYNLLLAIRLGTADDARRARMVLYSLVAYGLSLALAIFVFILGDPPGVADTVFGVGYLLHVILLLLAVLLYGALEPSLAIRKSVRVALMAVLGVFLFSGTENVLSDLVIGALGAPSIVTSFLAGGVVATAVALWRLRRVPNE
jgi:hypothetical protein